MGVILPVKLELAEHPLCLIYNTSLVFFVLTLKSFSEKKFFFQRIFQEKNWAIYTNLPQMENI